MSAYDGRAFAPFLADVEAVGLNTATTQTAGRRARLPHGESATRQGRVMVIGGRRGEPLASLKSTTLEKGHVV